MSYGSIILTLMVWMVSSGVHTFAQSTKTPVDTPLVSFKNKPKFFITLDRTSSFVSGKGASTNELRMGLDFKKKIRFGIGFAALVSDVVAEKNIVTNNGRDSVVNAELSVSYMTLSAEYTFFNSKRWQITTPVMMGIGSSYFNYFEKVNGSFETRKTDEGGVVILGASGIATYRIFRWVGLSAGLGFQAVPVSNRKIEESFNSPVYHFRIRVFLGEIYKTVFPRGISGKRNPPYSNEYWD